MESTVLFKDFNHEVGLPKRRRLLGGMLEKGEMLGGKKPDQLGIFIREDFLKQNIGESKNSHGIWLPRIQLILIELYIVFFFYSLYFIYKGIIRWKNYY